MFGAEPSGVCHADDLIYQFEPLALTSGLPFFEGSLSENDSKVREVMVTLWTNFAKFGAPTPPGSDYPWLPQQAGLEHHFYNISGTEPFMDSGDDIKRRMEFWYGIMG